MTVEVGEGEQKYSSVRRRIKLRTHAYTGGVVQLFYRDARSRRSAAREKSAQAQVVFTTLLAQRYGWEKRRTPTHLTTTQPVSYYSVSIASQSMQPLKRSESGIDRMRVISTR